MGKSTVVIWLGIAALAAACAPTRVAPSPEPRGPGAGTAPSRTFVMAFYGEPVSLASKPVQASGLSARAATRLFNAEFDVADASNTPRPYLVEALPQLDTDTWRLLPDGRMETTYRLKPNLVWHDGTPLAAEDFAFAWQVYLTPEFGQSGSNPVVQIEEVLTPDARTVVIRWKRPYPDSSFLRDTFQALPRHILQAQFQRGDPEVFSNLRYWSSEDVGLES